jgi:acyl-CoA thioesterase
MNHFDEETRVAPAGDGRFAGTVQPAWNIGANPNGGYLLAIAAQALRQAVPQHPDPLSITTHYLRPGQPGQPCTVEVQVLRTGRTLSTARATLLQDGAARLEVLAAMGDLGSGEAPPVITLPLPDMPPPDGCPGRSASAQGVGLAILDRLDIRLHPAEAQPGAAGRARVSGWIRFADGRAPDPLACLLMADAFPPAVFGLLGMVGWVPTIELTVHLRARPAPGWLLGQFVAEDLRDGRVIENGALWDSRGQLVAQSRQLALVRSA